MCQISGHNWSPSVDSELSFYEVAVSNPVNLMKKWLEVSASISTSVSGEEGNKKRYAVPTALCKAVLTRIASDIRAAQGFRLARGLLHVSRAVPNAMASLLHQRKFLNDAFS